MNAQTLASTPLFACSLVVCAFVAGYAFTVLLRFLLSGLSTAAAINHVDANQLNAFKIAQKFQKQVATLDSRMKLTVRLSKYVPDPFKDATWRRLQETYKTLKTAEQELTRLLRSGDFEDGVLLARFLSGGLSTPPRLKRSIDEDLLQQLVSWQVNATYALQRMVAKVEDVVRDNSDASQQPFPQDFFDTLRNVRKGIEYDENRYR